MTTQAEVCLACGCTPQTGTKHCPSCGAPTGAEAVICTRCGIPLVGSVPRSRLAAGLLGIFLGGLGIHRFYLGYVGIGIAQIFVTLITFGVGSLWGILEGLLILAGSFNRDAKGRPLRD